MKISSIIVGLSLLIAVLAAITTAYGLFNKTGGEAFTFTTLRGHKAQLYNQGLYRFDTVFFGAGFRGQDAVALFLGVPILVVAAILYPRGSLVVQLLLTGILGYFLYLYASMALGAAYNPLFLLYIAIFSVSFYVFIITFSGAHSHFAKIEIVGDLHRRGLAIFMLVSGLVTLVVWGGPLVGALVNRLPPERMDHYTTMVTFALDLAIITPATLVCAFLVWRGDSLGYVMAAPLLTLIILLAPQIILSTISQKAAGVPLSPGEMIGPVAGFVVLGVVAGWLLLDMLRGIASLS